MHVRCLMFMFVRITAKPQAAFLHNISNYLFNFLVYNPENLSNISIFNKNCMTP